MAIFLEGVAWRGRRNRSGWTISKAGDSSIEEILLNISNGKMEVAERLDFPVTQDYSDYTGMSYCPVRP
jgi:hypothetical protein